MEPDAQLPADDASFHIRAAIRALDLALEPDCEDEERFALCRARAKLVECLAQLGLELEPAEDER